MKKIIIICLIVIVTAGFALSENPVSESKTKNGESRLNSEQIEHLRREVDRLLASRNDTEIRRRIEEVFSLVDNLVESGRRDEALLYLDQALKSQPWALDYQMLYAELLQAQGQKHRARQKAEQVLKFAETDDLINRARLFLKERLPDIYLLSPRKHTVVLVPIGDVDVYVLEGVKRHVQTQLGMPVKIQDAHVHVPPCDREPYQMFLSDMRKRLLKGLQPNSPIAAFVRSKELTSEDLKHDDIVLETWRKYALKAGGQKALNRLNGKLDYLKKQTGQWKGLKLMASLRAAVRPFITEKVRFLGVTGLDIFTEDTNFVFGLTNPNVPIAVISYRRFTADFNSDVPNRPRLINRTSKQALSSIGFMLGVARCNDPTCPRAYPHSLAEHDAKSMNLCPACRKGFQRALASGNRRQAAGE